MARRLDDRGGATVVVVVDDDGTAFGDQVVLVGDLAAAGGWDPARGLALNGGGWPRWTGALTLPAGVRLGYKLVTRRVGGAVDWEWGDNRLATTPTASARATVAIQYRQ